MEKYKKRIFTIIQIGNKTDFASTFFDIFISFLIVISILATFLQTFQSLDFIRPYLTVIEFSTIVVFTVEYILRLWTAEYLYKNKTPIKATLAFIVSFYGLVDLLTIVSYFAPFLFSNGMVALRMLRVVRIMRLFKLNSSYDAFNVITDVLKEKKNQIISSVFMIIIMLLASSLCMYSLEHDAQPENFENAFSGIWWSVSTLLTVGYGDIYPITIGGKIMGIVIAFLGVGMVAIPTGIISAGFVEHYTRIKQGNYLTKADDFIALEIGSKHCYANKTVSEIRLPDGIYLAVVMNGDDVYVPYPSMIIKPGYSLLLASTSGINMDANIFEIKLEFNHSWIGKKIKNLDISRQMFVLMIKRNNVILQPEGDTCLLENDIVVLLDKR